VLFCVLSVFSVLLVVWLGLVGFYLLVWSVKFFLWLGDGAVCVLEFGFFCGCCFGFYLACV